MRWPRVSRKSHTATDIHVPHHDNTGDASQDVSQDPLDLKNAPPSGPGLSRMFSDAALYEKVLSACPEALRNGFFFSADDQTLPNCLGGFNQLIGRDLGDAERAVTGRLAELSVNNWTTTESTDDPFGAETPSEEERGENTSSDEGEDKKRERLSASSTLQEEQPGEPKLTPEEIVDLLEQEFGALAPPGEEKLLLETDAAFFNDVVILVTPFLPTY
jgi:sterol 3beta-glucosyltransferase